MKIKEYFTKKNNLKGTILPWLYENLCFVLFRYVSLITYANKKLKQSFTDKLDTRKLGYYTNETV